MDSGFDLTQLEPIIGREMRIEDVTTGGEKQGFRVRYRGRLVDEDTAAVYERLENALIPYGLMPLFRWDGDLHAVLIVNKPPAVKATNPRTNLWFFLATLVSVLITGAASAFSAPPSGGLLGLLWAILREGGPFAIAMLSILGAHEFGHYLVARYHRVNVSLPYFLPLPFISPFGTAGAFISMKEQPRNRRHLLDIGLAGPLAGAAIAIPVLLVGLTLSPVQPLPAGPSIADPIGFLRGNPLLYSLAHLFVRGQAPQQLAGVLLEGNSILYLLFKWLTHGQLLPAPPSYGLLPAALYWVRYYFSGQPIPFGGMDVQLHPLAWAGWGGLLVTAFNLTPAGQLDGGHALYVLVGRARARKIARIVLYATIVLGVFYVGWWLWTGLIYFLGRIYAEPRDEITPLDPARKLLAILGILLFFLVFIPVPLTTF